MGEPDVFSEEWRAQAVAWFLSSEKTIAEIAHTLNLSESVVREWVWNATPETVSDDGHPAPDDAVQAMPEATPAESAAINAGAVEAGAPGGDHGRRGRRPGRGRRSRSGGGGS